MPAPNVESAYRRALARARARGMLLTRQADTRIVAAMEEMLRALTRDVEERRITRARADQLKQEARRLLTEFQARFAETANGFVRITARDVALIHSRVNRELFKAAGIESDAVLRMARRFDPIPTRAVASIMARTQNAGTFQTVARRKLERVIPQMDAFIEGAVARGASAGRATLDLASILANGEPTVVARLPRGIAGRLHRGVGQIDFTRYGLKPDDVAEVRSVLYDARRIVVSETNNALREANTQSLVASPIITAAKWQRSGRHHHLDECDALSELDLHGYGPGAFPVEQWPFAPHPHCACTQGGPLIYRPIREWQTPKPAGRPLERDVRRPDLYPDAWKEQWTERRFERVRENLRDLVGTPRRERDAA
jgi:hypothetical protein